jgi:hypothetical protein
MILLAVVALVPAGFVLSRFMRWERDGRPVAAVVFIFGIVVIEGILFPEPFNVASGLFHPGSGALSFRLYDVLIPLALVARLLVRGWPRRVGWPLLWWAAFFVWMGTAAFNGLYNGNRIDQLTFEAKAIIYVGGGMALAAGVPWRDYVRSAGLRRLTIWSGVAAAVLCFTEQAHFHTGFSLPLVPVTDLGSLGSNLASTFVPLGIIALALASCSDSGRLGLTLAAAPLLISAIPAGQRAALVGMVTALLVIVVACGQRPPSSRWGS